MQITVRGNKHAYQRAKECGVGVKKRGRKAALRQQLLRPVEILQNQAQQLGALNDAGFDVAPLVSRNQQRNDIDPPGPIGPEGIAVDVVRNSVFANTALGAAPAPFQFFRADCPKRLHQVFPVRPGSHAISRQFVIGGSEAERILIKIDCHGKSSGSSVWVFCPGAGNRRSRVIGKIGLGSSSRTVILAGAWFDFSKRF